MDQFTFKKSFALLGAVALLFVGSKSFAQNAPSLDDVNSDSVSVNANRNKYVRKESDYVSKIPLKNMENAQVYSSISKELMINQMVFSVDDAIRNAPGLQKMWEATGRGGDGGAFYNTRGFIVQSQLRNGVAGNVTSRIDAISLDRIEVIKGPSATLFGSALTSYGGLINRVTKKPYERFGGDVTYSTGSYGFNRISADVNTPIDSAKTVLFRLNSAYNYEGTFQDNGFEQAIAIAPSLIYKFNPRLTFQFDAEYFVGKSTGRPFIFFYYPASALGATSAEDLGIDYHRSYSSNDIYQRSRSTNFFAQANYKISNEWTSQSNYTSTHSYSDGPLPYFYLVPDSAITGNPMDPGANYLARAVQATAGSELFVNEFQQNFLGDFKIGNIRNRVVVGLDFFTQTSNQMFYGTDFDTIPKNGTIPTYTNFNQDNLNAALQSGMWTWPYEYKNNTYSAYVGDVVNILPTLIASAALRVDYFDNKGSYTESTGEYSGEYQQLALAPKFGLVFQPVKDQVSIFGNYQSGFTNKTGKDFEGNSFKPEQAYQMEGGVKLDAFNGKLTSTISYYHISVTDVVRAYTPNPIFSIQDGTQISKGIEVEIIAAPVRGMTFVGGFAYNDCVLEKADADVQGRRPVTAMSPYVANLWVSYQLPMGALRGLGAGFGGNYASANKIMNDTYYEVFSLPAFAIFNATVYYDHPKYRLGFKIDNLTDQKYWIGYTTMNPQKLRSFTGSISVKF